jgi:hypothetical protein
MTTFENDIVFIYCGQLNVDVLRSYPNFETVYFTKTIVGDVLEGKFIDYSNNFYQINFNRIGGEGDTGVFLADLGGGWSLSVQIFSPFYSPQFEIFNNEDTFEPNFKRTEGGNLIFFDIHNPNRNYEISSAYSFFDQSIEFNISIDKNYLPIGIFAKSVDNFSNYDDYSLEYIQIKFVQDGITQTFTTNPDFSFYHPITNYLPFSINSTIRIKTKPDVGEGIGWTGGKMVFYIVANTLFEN